MASGKVHAAATAAVAGLSGPLLVLLAGQPLERAAAFVAGCALGLVVTPDLDVRHRDTHSDTIVRRSGGCLFGALWEMFWTPYAYLIPHHRHPLSHLPLLGTALRLVYLFGVPALLGWLLCEVLGACPEVNWAALVSTPPYELLAWAAGGLALVDALHVALDRVS